MPLVDLFTTSQNYRIQNYVSPFKDPMAVATDAFLFKVFMFPVDPSEGVIGRLVGREGGAVSSRHSHFANVGQSCVLTVFWHTSASLAAPIFGKSCPMIPSFAKTARLR